ncbi:hypothetical protein I311_05586 [Cryptococcus gattii NT-10]|nr:hypothetical protein I311_05586 [Cryptococcus gattii NT-10]
MLGAAACSVDIVICSLTPAVMRIGTSVWEIWFEAWHPV